MHNSKEGSRILVIVIGTLLYTGCGKQDLTERRGEIKVQDEPIQRTTEEISFAAVPGTPVRVARLYYRNFDKHRYVPEDEMIAPGSSEFFGMYSREETGAFYAVSQGTPGSTSVRRRVLRSGLTCAVSSGCRPSSFYLSTNSAEANGGLWKADMMTYAFSPNQQHTNFGAPVGFAWYLNQVPNSVPLYHMYNERSSDHIFTISRSERDALERNFPGIWKRNGSGSDSERREGIVGYAFPNRESANQSGINNGNQAVVRK